MIDIYQELPELEGLSDDDVLAVEMEGQILFRNAHLSLFWEKQKMEHPLLTSSMNRRVRAGPYVLRRMPPSAAPLQLLVYNLVEECHALIPLDVPSEYPPDLLIHWLLPITPAGYLVLFRKKGTLPCFTERLRDL